MGRVQEATKKHSIDLSTCEREPIHILGRIQAHGVLLVLSEPDLVIRHVSENVSSLWRVGFKALLGRTLEAALEPADLSQLRSRLEHEFLEADPAYLVTVAARNGDRYHVIAHRFKNRLVLELEPATAQGDISFHDLYNLLRNAVGRLKGARSVDELCRIVTEEVRRITGFDRIMVYRFDPEWNGRVVAEDKIDQWDSYLDLHFPASDIPAQARQLYLLNRLRLIVDVNSAPCDLQPRSDFSTGAPVDMSHAVLRSVSPVHIEYLRNMEVGASMSISIIKDDRLWGLIACHHRTARSLPYEVRAACEHLGELMALQLAVNETAEEADYRIALETTHSRLLTHMVAADDFVDGLVAHPHDLLAYAGAAGCAVFADGVLHLKGETPEQTDVEQLIEWLSANYEDDVFHTDSLAGVYPQAERFRDKASGLLAVSISRKGRSYIVWFRPELVRTVKWAGDPRKPVLRQPGHATRLHPASHSRLGRRACIPGH